MTYLPEIGEEFGDYQITGTLGHGGMGVVYTAVQRRLSREVALKVLSPQFVDASTFRDRFVREAETLSRLDSPHIIHIYDYGEQDGCLYMSTQWVRGGDLNDLLARGPLPAQSALQVADHIASALEDAHEAGVIHRDVKPSNVLLREGKVPFAYLCDFGIAQTSDQSLTTVGSVIGTWAYLAPERCNGSRATPASDIYSLGCVLWAMLTGEAPYTGSAVSIAMSHVNKPVPQLEARDEATRLLNGVLERAMAKEPIDRYSTVSDMRSDLAALAGHLSGATGGRRAPLTALREVVPADATVTRRPPTTTAPSGVSGDVATRPEPKTGKAGLVVGAVLLAGIVAVGAIAGAVALLGKGDPSSSAHAGTARHPSAASIQRSPVAKPTSKTKPKAAGGGTDASTKRDARRNIKLTRVSYDGDGLSDVGIQTFTGVGNINILKSNGSGFNEPEGWTSLPAPPAGAPIHRLNGDFDGDGKTDAAILEDSDVGERVSVLTSNGASFDAPAKWGSVPDPIANGAYPLVGDFDGDGRMDLVSVGWNSSGVNLRTLISTGSAFRQARLWAQDLKWSFSDVSLVPGDFNRDGRTDIAAVQQLPNTLRVDVVLSEGSHFARPRLWQEFGHQNLGRTKPMAGDFDGDGTTDLMVYMKASASGGVTTLFLRSTGSSFRAPESWWSEPDWALEKSWVSAGDFDGDGSADVARIAPSADGVDVWVMLSTGNGLRLGHVWGSWSGHNFDDVRTLNRAG